MSERRTFERDPWLTEREAAKELRVSVYCVRLEREAGRLGHARLRKRVFYPLSMIEAYRQSITCPAKSASGGIPSANDTTSPGPSVGARSALRRAQEIIGKHSGSARPSS